MGDVRIGGQARSSAVDDDARDAERGYPKEVDDSRSRTRAEGPWRLLSFRVGGAVQTHPVIAVLVIALVVRIAAVLVIWWWFGGVVFNDDGYYLKLARDFVSGNTDSWGAYPHILFWGTASFLLPLTGLMAVFGESAIVGQLFVALCGAVAAAFTARLALVRTSSFTALGAGLVVALLPSQILFSSVVLKDAQVWAALAAMALGVRLLVTAPGRLQQVKSWALLVSAWLLLAFLREHTLIVASWSVVAALAFVQTERRIKMASAALVLALFIPWLAGLGLGGIDFVTNAGSLEQRRAANAENANTAVVAGRDGIDGGSDLAEDGGDGEGAGDSGGGGDSEHEGTDGGSDLADDGDDGEGAGASGGGGDPDSVDRNADRSGDRNVGTLRYLPRGLSVFLLEPLPWREGNVRVRLAKAENVVWYALLVLAVVGAWRMLRESPGRWMFLFLFAGGITVVYSLVEGNYGTAFRHRGEIVWVVALAASVGLRWLLERASEARSERATEGLPA